MSVVPFQRDAQKPTGGKPMLGELLCARGLLSHDQLRLALHEQKQAYDLLGRVLVRMRFVGEGDVQQALAVQTGLPTINLLGQVPEPQALSYLDRETALALRAVPLAEENGTLIVALADPQDVRALDTLRRRLPAGKIMRLMLAQESDLERFIDKAYGKARNLNHWLAELEQQPLSAALASDDHPVVQTVNSLLQQAVAAGASDIHLEPEEKSIRVRVRIDGVLRPLTLIHREHWPMLAQRVKVLAGMDIVDSRNIQDGRFDMHVAGQAVDFRASILPTLYGENIVIRILDRRRALLPFDKLGFSVPHQAALKRLMQRPEGMLIMTGPTGSGKTTTLYALLQMMKSDARNIMTLEDPIEYQIEGLRQTQVREQFGLGFAEGVRAILRQDPDIVLVGEMRDPDTAQMALRAAMTGGRVFSTLHTQDCFGVFPRLRELGLAPGLMAGNIIGTVAQRLVRMLCTDCRHEQPATEEECTFLADKTGQKPLLWKARGCSRCENTGYRGRMVVAEVLPIDMEMDELVANGTSRAGLYKAARARGFTSMAEDGLAKMREGHISLEILMEEVDITPRSAREG